MSHEILCCTHAVRSIDWMDVANGAFEAGGAFCTWANFRRIRKDRQVRGVDWRLSVFFSSWGIWNLGYYPSLHQWFSLAGGLALVAGNVGWLYYAIRFRRN